MKKEKSNKKDKESYGHQPRRLVNYFKETRLDGDYIDYTEDSLKLIKKAKDNDKLIKFNKNTFLCLFKTKFKTKPAVMMIFLMEIPGSSTGSSSSSQLIMEYVRMLENMFLTIDKFWFCRHYEKNKDACSLIVVKQINEDDII